MRRVVDRWPNIEALLIDVGAHVSWPEPPTAFAARIAGKLEAETPRRVGSLHRLAPVMATLGAIVVVLIAFSPGTRDAVADFFGIGGVRLERVGPGRIPTPRSGAVFAFGEQVGLEEARSRVDFGVLVPSLSELGAPDEVYVSARRPTGGLVALVYGDRAGFEPDPATGVSVLITQFQAALPAQGPLFGKVLGPEVVVQRVEVNGREGYWLSGEPHSFLYRDANGKVVQESVRLVGNVLLWEERGVTLRVETLGPLPQALEIAASLR